MTAGSFGSLWFLQIVAMQMVCAMGGLTAYRMRRRDRSSGCRQKPALSKWKFSFTTFLGFYLLSHVYHCRFFRRVISYLQDAARAQRVITMRGGAMISEEVR